MNQLAIQKLTTAVHYAQTANFGSPIVTAENRAAVLALLEQVENLVCTVRTLATTAAEKSALAEDRTSFTSVERHLYKAINAVLDAELELVR